MKMYFARLAVLLAALMPVAAQAAGGMVTFNLATSQYKKDGEIKSGSPSFVDGQRGQFVVLEEQLLPTSTSFSINSKMPNGYYASGWVLSTMPGGFGSTVASWGATDSVKVEFDYKWAAKYGTALELTVSITQMWYSVKYEANGGTISPAPPTGSWLYSKGDTLPTGSVATREGYTLTGWMVGSTSTILPPGESFTGETLGVASNNQTVTLTAQWTANSYTATIATGEGGTGGGSVNYDYSASQQSKAITLPTREGHAIEKWTASAYSGSAPTIEGNSLKIPGGTSGNFTMTPTWKAVSCTITTGVVPAGSGTVSGGGTYDYGKSVTLTASAGKGYAFVQWQDGNTDNPRTITVTKSAEYTATFKALSYKATIAAGEGGTGGCTTNYAYSTSAQTMTITLPTRTGHTISGWEAVGQTGSDPTIKGTTLTIPANTYGDFTMMPTWKAVSCAITTGVTPAGSGTVSGGGTYDYGKSVTLTASAGKGYAFVQWQDGNTDNPRTITVTSAATYTATFQTQGYTATITPGEKGSGGCQIGYDYSESQQTKPIQSLPTRRGHSISGWTATGYAGSAPSISDTTLTIPARTSGDFTMKPSWKANTITVMYYGNGETAGAMNDSSFTYDVQAALRMNAFEKSYTVTYNANGGDVTPSYDSAVYEFFHWNSQKDGQGAYTYENREIVTNPCGAESGIVPLYAQWKDADPVTLPTPTKEGSAFLGWYTAQTGGDFVGMGGSEYVPQKKITLFAHWGTTPKYAITVKAEPTSGGTVSGGGTYDAGASATLTATPNPGYSFTRWDDGVTTASRVITVTGDATYTAKFIVADPPVYYVAFDGNGATSGEMAVQTIPTNAPTALNPNQYAKTGASFAGWAEERGGAVVYADEQEVKDIAAPGKTNTLYATWTPWKNYVDFDGNGKTSGEMAVQTFEYGVTNKLTKNGFKKDGFTFQGWTNETKKAFYTDGQKVAFYDPDDTTNTLKAVWTVNTYTMHFEPNASTVLNPTAQGDIPDCKSGEGVTLPECKYVNLPSRGFDGWVDQAGVTNKAGTSVTRYVSQSGTTLTYNAAWLDGGDLSGVVGLAGIAALTNQTEATKWKWEVSAEEARTGGECIAHKVPEETVEVDTKMSMLVKGVGSVSFYYKHKGVAEGMRNLKLWIDDEPIPTDLDATTEYRLGAVALTDDAVHTVTWEYKADTLGGGAFYVDDVSWITNVTTYAVAFDGNGATGGTMTPQEVTVGVPTALKTNEFMRKGYDFMGWTTNATGGVVYADKAEVTNLAEPGKATTLYAVWEAVDVGPLSKAVGLTNAKLTTEGVEWTVAKEEYRTGPECITCAPNGATTSLLSMAVDGPGKIQYYVKGQKYFASTFTVLTNGVEYGSVTLKEDYPAAPLEIDVAPGVTNVTWEFVGQGTGNFAYMDDVRWTPKGGEPKPFIFVIE